MQVLNLEEYELALREAAEGDIEKSPSRWRLGRFVASSALISHESWPDILEKLSFVPVRVELCYGLPAPVFEYIGFSPCFRELEQSENTQVYTLQIWTNDAGDIEEVSAIDHV